MTNLTKVRVLLWMGLVLGIYGLVALTAALPRILPLLPEHPAYVAGCMFGPMVLAIGGLILWYRSGRKLDKLKAESGQKRERNIAERRPTAKG